MALTMPEKTASSRLAAATTFSSGKVVSNVANAGIVVFLASIPIAIVTSLLRNNKGFDLVVVALMYPSLIVGLGTIAASDLVLIGLIFRHPQGVRKNWLLALLTAGRGTCFAMFVAMIVRFELKLLGFID